MTRNTAYRPWRHLFVSLFLLLLLAVTAAASDAVGATRSLNCATGWGGSLSKEPCVLAAKTDHADIYVMVDDRMTADDSFLPSGETPSANAASFAAEFESIYSAMSNPSSDQYFGQPWSVNGDGRVLIILMDISLDNGAIGGFDQGRFVGKSTTPTAYDDMMLYMDISDSRGFRYFTGSPQKFYTTLAHEYAHLLNYSYHVANGASRMKDLWLDEGLAELAGLFYSQFPNFSMLGAYMIPPHYSMVPTDSQWRSCEGMSDPTFNQALAQSVGVQLLHYYESGASIHDLVSDTRSVDSKEIVAAHYGGGDFDTFFEQAMLSFYVDDPLGKGPHLRSFDVNTRGQMDLYYFGVQAGKSVPFTHRTAQYMPNYFVRQYRSDTATPFDTTHLVVNLADNSSYGSAKPTSFYAVYADAAGGRVHVPLAQGETKIPYSRTCGDLRFVAITFGTSKTDATLTYQFENDGTGPELKLHPPTDMRARISGNAVKLSWTAPKADNESLPPTSYDVYRDGAKLASTTTCDYTDAAYTPGKAATYYAVSRNGDKSSVPGPSVTVGGKAGTPRNLAATAKGTSVTLTWQAPQASDQFAAVSRYEVFMNGTSYKSVTSTSLTITGLTPGKTYTFYLVGHASESLIAPSDPTATVSVTIANAFLNPPTNLRAEVEQTSITLQWDAPSTANGALAAQSYEVYRDGSRITTTTTRSYTDRDRTMGAAYRYTVVAVNGAVKSNHSAALTVTVSALKPPRNLTCTVDGTTVKLHWTEPVSGKPDSYQVYLDDDWEAQTSLTGYTLTDLTRGASYRIHVTAEVDGDESSASNVVTVKIPRSFPSSSDWAKPELEEADREGLIPEGFPDRYQQNITREEFCQIVVCLYERLTGKTAPLVSNPFSDTNSEAVIQCYGLGIVQGVGEGQFRPNSNIVRQEVATILYRMLQAAKPTLNFDVTSGIRFTDAAQIATWAREAVAYMAHHGIINGKSNNRFAPKDFCTREQAIAMALRTLQKFR